MKLGIIGIGNMASAMVNGILKNKLLEPDDIVASRRNKEELVHIEQKYGIETTTDNKYVVKQADVIILAVKPQFLEDVCTEIRDEIKAKETEPLFLSLAPGKTIAFLGERLDTKKVVRCMPNTPALVGEGCTGVSFSSNVSSEEKEEVISLLQSFGKAIEVPERLMDSVVGISGSSPAYVFLFIEAMADAAVVAGMPRKQAYEFAAQAVLGSAKMVLESGMHPGELKDMVCSPGGTTIQAVKVLEEGGFRGIVMDAIEACIETSKNL